MRTIINSAPFSKFTKIFDDDEKRITIQESNYRNEFAAAKAEMKAAGFRLPGYVIYEEVHDHLIVGVTCPRYRYSRRITYYKKDKPKGSYKPTWAPKWMF